MNKLILGRFGIDACRSALACLDHNYISQETSCPVTQAYHYTSIEILDKILATGSFFSTDCRYQNDPNEFLLGYKILIHELKNNEEVSKLNYFPKILAMPDEILTLLDCESAEITPYKNNFSSIYTISFCKDADDLGQWDRYAGECGVAIEIDFSYLADHACLAIRSNTDNLDDPKYVRINTIPFNIAYSEEQINLLVRAFIKQMEIFDVSNEDPSNDANFLLKTTVNLLASHIKDKRYHHEQEVRICFYPHRASARGGQYYNSELIYTTNNHCLIPHVPVYCFKNDPARPYRTELDPALKSGWPIKKIIVGPGGNQDSAFESLIHRLEAGSVKAFYYTDEEILDAKINHAIAAKEAYLQNKKLTEEQKTFYDNVLSLDDKRKKFIQLQYEKYRLLADISINHEKRRYCTAQGIEIEKSNLQYNFKQR